MQDKEGMPVTPRQWMEQGNWVGFFGRRTGCGTGFKFLGCGIDGGLLRFGGEGSPLLGPPIGAAPKPREVIETPLEVSAFDWGPTGCLVGGTEDGNGLAGGGGPVAALPGRVIWVPLGRLGICGFFTFEMLMDSGGMGGAGAVSGSPSTMITSLSPAAAPNFSWT